MIMATKRRAVEFKDAFGVPVRVGDAVRGHTVNESLSGTVIALNGDREQKPYVVRSDDGSGLVWYANKEYIKKVSVPKANDKIVRMTTDHLERVGKIAERFGNANLAAAIAFAVSGRRKN